jgi:hypothetical protein
MLLKPRKPIGREEPGDFHPIINKWGGEWMVPEPGEGVSLPGSNDLGEELGMSLPGSLDL